MRLSLGVQHHISRPRQLEQLRRLLRHELEQYDADERGTLLVDGAGVRFDVSMDDVMHEPPSPWRGSRKAWAATPVWATHRLVLQDDVLPCADFVWGAIEAIRHRPNGMVAFYQGHFPQGESIPAMQGPPATHWHLWRYGGFVPCVALAMPAHLARSLSRYTPPNPERPTIADDEAIARFVDQERYEGRWVDVWCTVPSLAQHDDDAPSTIVAHRPYARTAACFLADGSAKDVDFAAGTFVNTP